MSSRSLYPKPTPKAMANLAVKSQGKTTYPASETVTVAMSDSNQSGVATLGESVGEQEYFITARDHFSFEVATAASDLLTPVVKGSGLPGGGKLAVTLRSATSLVTVANAYNEWRTQTIDGRPTNSKGMHEAGTVIFSAASSRSQKKTVTEEDLSTRLGFLVGLGLLQWGKGAEVNRQHFIPLCLLKKWDYRRLSGKCESLALRGEVGYGKKSLQRSARLKGVKRGQRGLFEVEVTDSFFIHDSTDGRSERFYSPEIEALLAQVEGEVSELGKSSSSWSHQERVMAVLFAMLQLWRLSDSDGRFRDGSLNSLVKGVQPLVKDFHHYNIVDLTAGEPPLPLLSLAPRARSWKGTRSLVVPLGPRRAVVLSSSPLNSDEALRAARSWRGALVEVTLRRGGVVEGLTVSEVRRIIK